MSRAMKRLGIPDPEEFQAIAAYLEEMSWIAEAYSTLQYNYPALLLCLYAHASGVGLRGLFV